jgi:predicted amidohydrolase
MTNRRFVAAVVQLRSTEDIENNLRVTEQQVRRAVSLGATLVAVPENFAFLRIHPESDGLRAPVQGELVQRMASLAKEVGADLILGSIPEPSAIEGKVHNTSVYISHTGNVIAAYRKLHLFDIDIPGTVTLRESDHITPGSEPCLVDSRFGPVGLSICYDLRFPELYRQLRKDGARILTCPAAFTLQTGKDHWAPLLRARAIENQAWVLAPGQFGHHGGKRNSYGKSMIIDPWGIPVAVAKDGIGVAIAEIDLDYQDKVRAGLPCHTHRHSHFWGS